MSATSAARRLQHGVTEHSDLSGHQVRLPALPWRPWPPSGRRRARRRRSRPVTGRRSGATAGGEQYFSRRPASRSERRTVAVRLPDVRLDLVTDRGVFAGARLDPGPRRCCAGASSSCPTVPCSTSAAGTGRSPSRSPAATRRPPSGPSTSTSGPATSASRTSGRPALANVTVAAPRRRARRPPLRRPVEQPAHPHRQGPAPRAAPALAGPARRRRGRPPRRAQAPRLGLAGPLAGRAGLDGHCAAPPTTATASSTSRRPSRGSDLVVHVLVSDLPLWCAVS